MSGKGSGTSFHDAVRLISNPTGVKYKAYVSGISTTGDMGCGAPPWDPHGTYRLALNGGQIMIQRFSDGAWVASPLTAPASSEQLTDPVSTTVPDANTVPDAKQVFVIHGRNVAARDQLAIFLRACGLRPINFGDLRAEMGGTPTIDRIVEEGMARAQGVVALITADEYAALHPHFRSEKDDEVAVARWQARPNVIFEAGMAFGRNRNRVVFVLLGAPRLFTDVAGVHVLAPTNDAKGDRSMLRETLRKGMGCAVDESTDWMSHGDFENCLPKSLEMGPSDPFGAKTAGGTVAEVSDGDARILLAGWLHALSTFKSGRALEYASIAVEARVTTAQVRNLLVEVVRASGDRWSVEEQGDAVIRLRHAPRTRGGY